MRRNRGVLAPPVVPVPRRPVACNLLSGLERPASSSCSRRPTPGSYPPWRVQPGDEAIHHRDQMEGGAVELFGEIVLASSLDQVGPLSEAVDTVQPTNPEGQVVLISIDLNESLLSLFAGGRLVENRLNRRHVERLVEYPVPWTEPVVEAVDNSHEVIQLVFDLEKLRALIPRDESGQQLPP